MKKNILFLSFLFFLFFALPDHIALAFSHPGLLNNQAELDLIKAKVAARAEPWYSGYLKIPDYRSHTPIQETNICWDGIKGTTTYVGEIFWDSRAAYGSALRWLVTGDTTYAQKAVSIFNIWNSKTFSFGEGDYLKSTLLDVAGGFPQMIWAAEIIRATYGGWNQTDQDKFKQFLINKVYPTTKFPDRTTAECVSGYGNNNWGALGAETRMAVAIYADRQDYFNEAVLDFKFLNDKTFKANGKNIETCRCTTSNGCGTMPNCSTSNCIGCNDTGGGDLEHTQMTLSAMTAMAEMAKKQGVDLYGYEDPVSGNSLLTTLAFHAPFIGYPLRGSKINWPCSVSLENAVGQEVKTGTRRRSFYEMAYNHYRTEELKSIVLELKRPEENIGWADVGWGTLTHTYYGQLSNNTAPSAPTGVKVV